MGRHNKRNTDSIYIVVWFLIGTLALAFMMARQYDTERYTKPWIGFYKPVDCPECTEEYYRSEDFPTLEICKQWGETIRQGRAKAGETFSCGKDCKDSGGEFICKKLEDF